MREGWITGTYGATRGNKRRFWCHLLGHKWVEHRGTVRVRLPGRQWENRMTDGTPEICARCQAVKEFWIATVPPGTTLDATIITPSLYPSE